MVDAFHIAVNGSVFFYIQTALLDAILWSAFFRLKQLHDCVE